MNVLYNTINKVRRESEGALREREIEIERERDGVDAVCKHSRSDMTDGL